MLELFLYLRLPKGQELHLQQGLDTRLCKRPQSTPIAKAKA